jgi:hypothetical protein
MGRSDCAPGVGACSVLGYIVAWIVMPNGPFFVPAAYTAQPVASQPEQGTQPQA